MVQAQDYIFFGDSPSTIFYDWSWGFVNAPSQLERIGEKFPVDTTYFYAGLNSLRLRWTSKTGGDWGFAVAAQGTPWPTHDVTKKDSLVFWAYSTEFIDSLNLPLIYLEDNTNKKTNRIKLSVYANDISADTWTRISVPLRVFTPGTQGADLTIIKTIFYGQDVADNVEHRLFLDEIRMKSAGTAVDTIPPAMPQGLTTKAFDRHIDLKWNLNNEPDLAGCKIYRFDGTAYRFIATVNKDEKFYTDFVGSSGVTRNYKISAYDVSLNESPLTAAVNGTTYAMTDEQLLTMLQEATFRYFWDYAHPTSGLIRERTGSQNTVTIGGSGFGVMALLVGIERGFITRDEGIQRMLKILNFLATKAQRYHGAWSHWLNGETGTTIPFSTYDNGGDLVETAFMIQGLLAAKEYFNQNTPSENIIRVLIKGLWEGVEWDWYRKDSTSNFLYWHWSPNYGWQMNFKLQGPNETQITYLLGIASPTHGIPPSLYHNGWASSPNYLNGKTFYGIPLYVGWDFGGPLFFAHYSFLGFDPRHKKDIYTNYFINNRNHTLINRAYCIANPKGYAGYGENTWGLTASDDPWGYSAHEPTSARDNGTIAPTAALSSMPYTPTQSIAAFKNFYYNYGKDIWGSYGFKDAFNPQYNWFAPSYLAIDQGPIIVMVENYRSGLLWNKFMANPEIQPMLNAIGFMPDTVTSVDNEINKNYSFELKGNYPNPFNPKTIINYQLAISNYVTLKVYDLLGREVAILVNEEKPIGEYEIEFDANKYGLSSGVYIYTVKTQHNIASGKMILQK